MHNKQNVKAGRIKAGDPGVEQIYSVWSGSGCLLLCRRAAEPLDSGGGGELKYKVKVLLRSQSNFIPPLLVYGRLAYGDTKGRSISIADGAARERKSAELAVMCVINQLMAERRAREGWPLMSPSVIVENVFLPK